MKELINIQHNLKAPKGQYNSFGKYKYRSCEDILEAVKPLLNENGCFLTLSDEVIAVGDRIYVKAIATLTNSEGVQISVSALAREEDQKKGMDGSQITGTASSYARKYALNGLFCIDDTKDADTDAYKQQQQQEKKTDETLELALDDVRRATTREQVKQINANWASYKENETFRAACNAKYQSLKA
jgi:hypothetical protein